MADISQTTKQQKKKNVNFDWNFTPNFVPMGRMKNSPALVQAMACRPGWQTIIWTNGGKFTDPYGVTRPQYVNTHLE